MLPRSLRSAQCTQRLVFGWLHHTTHLTQSRAFHASGALFRTQKPSKKQKTRQNDGHKPENLVQKSLERSDSYRRTWSKLPIVQRRFKGIGLSQIEADNLLRGFVSSNYSVDEEKAVIRKQQRNSDLIAVTDRTVTQSLFQWIRANESDAIVPEHIRQRLIRIAEAADASHPAEWYPRARARRRKIVMHVGPTNSGKTHNALRALASARTGVYAGPLRLLAHEIFYRFNKGMILPKDASPDDPPGKHARACNMITGEEQRIVDLDAGLVSCTVEMLNYYIQYDIAVVDEIQMISDPERGGAWTSALLGLCAKEIHLCGEDSVVPLIESILKETGDELIVNRYDRLTPLTIAKESLDGDLSQIRKGDCVVTFSRTGIFQLKKSIEAATGMRCAIAYGRLPPEVRSEQAALFNDPNSGYDVLVGSDALGMGLNLKIRRIIFESMHKWDGREEVALSVSQVKQIAGRAGRFGLHGDEEAGGEVTTLFYEDLPLLRELMSAPIPTSTKRATLPNPVDLHAAVEELLPEPSFTAVFDINTNVAAIGEGYMTRDHISGERAAKIIDAVCRNMILSERMLVFNAPIPWRDNSVVEVALVMLRVFRESALVGFQRSVSDSSNAAIAFEAIELHERGAEFPQSMSTKFLQGLESLYRIAVVYLWFSYRFPVSFGERAVAAEVKKKTEGAIEWCLEKMKDKKKPKSVKKRQDEERYLSDVVADTAVTAGKMASL